MFTTIYFFIELNKLNYKEGFNMELSILFSIVFIYEYVEKKNKSILLGIPLIIYCFVILPLLSQKLDKVLTVLVTLIVCVPICISVYHGTKVLKK